ncbi:MAG: hypothetical protein ACO1OB_07060 [Archangium sp.]
MPRQLAFLPFGIVPFVSGFFIVHCVALIIPPLRRRSVGSQAQQRPLVLASLVLGVAMLLVQTSAVVKYLESFANGNAVIPPPAALWVQFVVAHLLLLGLMLLVTRLGMMNGFALGAVVEAANHVPSVVKNASAMVADETVTIAAVLLLLTVLVFFAFFFLKLARASRPTFDAVPSRVPFPIAGLLPWAFASGLLSLPVSLAAWNDGALEVARALQRSSWLYLGVHLTLVVLFSLSFGWLFFRPRAVGALWLEWKKVDGTNGARVLLPVAQLRSAVAIAAVPLTTIGLLFVLRISLGANVLTDLLACAFVFSDLVDERRARRSLGQLATVRAVQRMAEVEPLLAVLKAAKIPAFARSFHFRATLQFFGPYAPVEICVPVAREAEAAQRLA